MSQENGYPVRGVLLGYAEGSMSLEEAEEMLDEMIVRAGYKGYYNAYQDAEKNLIAKAYGMNKDG